MTENQTTAKLIATVNSEERQFLEAKGTLEMQNMALQKLARCENMAKGLQSGPNSLEMWQNSFEEVKRETTQILHTIWDV